ncbi:hypothetical protein [Maridesulfovibrio sp.]|uniref:hypothetical protein n=1 Tax=unclassified Maridesulfovibrio TaxID=2794999 RepID=UPI003AFFCF8C
MRQIYLFFTLALILFLVPCRAFCNDPIPISIERNALEQVKALEADLAVPLGRLETIPDVEISRTTADVIILLKALYLGGIDSPIEFIEVPNARRSAQETARGRSVLCSQQLNKEASSVAGYENSFWVTDPIARFGEFQKGFYCLPKNTDLLAATSAAEINKLGKGIIGQHWGNDFRILRDMGITNMISAPTFNSMVKMIEARRADWIPLEISTSKDFSMNLQGVHLVPIMGIKFSLLESRHFLVSRKHPRGKEVYKVLQKGIKELRKQGFVRKIMTKAGIFNPRTDSWKILNGEDIELARN